MGPWLDRRVTGSCLAPSREQQGPREERPPVLGPGMGVQRKGGRGARFSPSEAGPPAGSSEDSGSGTVGSLGDGCFCMHSGVPSWPRFQPVI